MGRNSVSYHFADEPALGISVHVSNDRDAVRGSNSIAIGVSYHDSNANGAKAAYGISYRVSNNNAVVQPEPSPSSSSKVQLVVSVIAAMGLLMWVL